MHACTLHSDLLFSNFIVAKKLGLVFSDYIILYGMSILAALYLLGYMRSVYSGALPGQTTPPLF